MINFEQLADNTRKKELRLSSVKPTSPTNTKRLHPYEYNLTKSYIFQNVHNDHVTRECRFNPHPSRNESLSD